MNRTLCAILILVFAGCFCPSYAQVGEENDLQSIIEEFRRRIENDVADDNVKGSISVAITKGDQIIWSGAYGAADFNSNIESDSTTIYRTGSITKSFTAFLMMQLVEDGTIKLNDPIEQYLPEIKGLIGYSNTAKINFQHLASHTSGLIREPKLDNAATGPIENWETKILQSIPKTSFKSKPGEQFGYSNIGYGILGLAISRAANKSFIELVKERIFNPLHMTNSFFIVPESRTDDLAKGMNLSPYGTINPDSELEHRGRGYKVPNGGIYSTPNDLAKFIASNLGYTGILQKNNLTIMHSKQTPEGNYGLGFFLYSDSTIKTVGHGGGVVGYTCHLVFEKESQYGVILMRNYNRGKTQLNAASHDLIRKLKKR
ncbi:serine hydrolase domain-containing protein [uncultured Kriegella sp.]|uniref:serine hydrolase domain-containing protein n=1 Tax=uncultured Kriegella sp. TaxID=1798910 RepID=UPI0030D9AE1E|tara:strand:+ start:6823 stop:7941 length:1119 start_codon:yes stop_codon:yes gene_type:complete